MDATNSQIMAKSVAVVQAGTLVLLATGLLPVMGMAIAWRLRPSQQV